MWISRLQARPKGLARGLAMARGGARVGVVL